MEEVDEQYRKLLQIAYFKNTYSIHCFEKKDSGWFS